MNGHLNLFANRRKNNLRARNAARPRFLAIETLEYRLALATAYIATDLVSDEPGVAPIIDETLHNAWGIAVGPLTFWVSSEGGGISEVYSGDVAGTPLTKNPLEVSIPGGEPTGQVFNPTTDFVISAGGASAPSFFIFASKSGSITGWNPTVPPPAPSMQANLGFQASDGAAYTGIALATRSGANFLYAADFKNGKIDVLDANFHLTTLAGSFTDPDLPEDYAPFNVAAINGQLYVAYAPREEEGDEVEEIAGRGNGVIDIFTTDGQFVDRLISHGKLNDPWAMVVAPANFGDFSNALLVGNVGSGRILAYDPTTGAFKGTLSSSPGNPIEVEELWGLAFGNGVTAGDKNSLYYAGGPDEEEHGVFGRITANPAGTVATRAVLEGDVLRITGGRDGDRIQVGLNNRHGTKTIVVQADGTKIGSFNAQSVATIEVRGFAGNDHIHISPKISAKTILDGGADNDVLFAGGGPSVLLGGMGTDRLIGGRMRDILIGGDDRDFAFGSFGQDILIGGTTAHDQNMAALLAILDEWTANRPFDVRGQRLTDGTGGVPPLNDTTVLDDGVRDLLFGGPDQDWVFEESMV